MSETLIRPDKVRACLATDYRIGETDLCQLWCVHHRLQPAGGALGPVLESVFRRLTP